MARSGFLVDYRLVDAFFDRPAVLRRIGRAKVRMLGKAGSHVQRRARSSLRKRKRVSQPGQPPSVHSEDNVATLKNILFGLVGHDTVIIGPVGLNQVQESWIDSSIVKIPELMEFGDVITIREVSNDGGRTWKRRDMRRSFAKSYQGYMARKRRAVYRPRPVMGPALKAEAPKFPTLFDTIPGGSSSSFAA